MRCVDLMMLSCLSFITRIPTELRDAYESAAAELRSQLKARGERLSELMEAAAHSAAQLEELRHEVEEVSSLGWRLQPWQLQYGVTLGIPCWCW